MRSSYYHAKRHSHLYSRSDDCVWPLSMLEELDAPDVIKFSEENNGVHDVPTWRIGDKWVYETQFDVAQLIQQGNVSASLTP